MEETEKKEYRKVLYLLYRGERVTGEQLAKKPRVWSRGGAKSLTMGRGGPTRTRGTRQPMHNDRIWPQQSCGGKEFWESLDRIMERWNNTTQRNAIAGGPGPGNGRRLQYFEVLCFAYFSHDILGDVGTTDEGRHRANTDHGSRINYWTFWFGRAMAMAMQWQRANGKWHGNQTLQTLIVYAKGVLRKGGFVHTSNRTHAFKRNSKTPF